MKFTQPMTNEPFSKAIFKGLLKQKTFEPILRLSYYKEPIMKVCNTLLSAIILLHTDILVAKNLENVQPPAEEAAEVKKPASVTASNSPVTTKWDGLIRVSTSYGLASLKIDDNDYKIGGASDFKVSYKFSNSLMGMPAFATFRYAGHGVFTDIDGEDYTGSVSGIFFGAGVDVPIQDGVIAFGGAELGGFLQDLEDTQGTNTSSPPSDFAAGLVMTGGANYMLQEKLAIGPRIDVGFGGFTTWSLLFQAELTM